MLTRTWARGVTTTYGYNNAGELASVDYADGTPDVTAIAYNGLGQLTGRSDAAGVLVRQPRADGQPGNENWSSGVFSGAGVTRGYDGLGRPGSLAGTLPGGASVAAVTMGYSATSGRLETLTGFGQSWTLQWLERLGQVREVTASNGMKSTRNFDALGRLSSITTQKAGEAVVAGLTSTYDALNRRDLATREDGTVWDYEYDPLGQVISGVRKTATGTVLPGFAFGYDFDSIGNRESATINGRTESYTPTALNTYTSKTNAGAFDLAGTAEPGSEVYLRGTAGAAPTAASRVEKWFSVAAPANNAAGPVRVTANLVALKKGAGSGGADVMVGGSRSQVVRPANESFTYDDDGNLTADGLWTYTWDGENRLVSMTPKTGLEALLGEKFTYGYDGESRRIWTVRTGWNAGSGTWETTTSRERYLYDGWNILAVFDDQNTATKTFLWGPDLSGTMQGAGGVGGLLFCNFVQNTSLSSMPFYDGNGNVLGLLGTDGTTVTARYEYGPFGEALGLTGPAAALNPFRWSTKFSDKTGLVYYGYRYYNPETGRWVNRDPIGERGGKNLYTYCENASVNKIDPIGLSAIDWGVPGRFNTSTESVNGKTYTRYNTPIWFKRRLLVGRPCYDCPAKHTLKRNDSTSWFGGSVTMSVELTFKEGVGYGKPKNVLLLWETCYRHDLTVGFIPGSVNSLTSSISGFNYVDILGNTYETGAHLSYLSCVDGKWKIVTDSAYSYFHGLFFGGGSGWGPTP